MQEAKQKFTASWTIGGDFVIGDADDEGAPLVTVTISDDGFREFARREKKTFANDLAQAMRWAEHPFESVPNAATGHQLDPLPSPLDLNRLLTVQVVYDDGRQLVAMSRDQYSELCATVDGLVDELAAHRKGPA